MQRVRSKVQGTRNVAFEYATITARGYGTT